MGGRTARAPLPALWRCPRCERRFASRNLYHACGDFSLDAHFAGKAPVVRRLFDAMWRRLRAIGPVRVEPQKTRIVFTVRMRFVAVTPRRSSLPGHLLLTRRVPSPRLRPEGVGGLVLHRFRLERIDDLDAEFDGWLRESYSVGRQRHLGRPASR